MAIRIMPKQPKRLFVLVSILAVVLAIQWGYPAVNELLWRPSTTIATDHYVIYSTATPEQTRNIGHVLEALHSTYARFFASFSQVSREHPKLKLKLFKNREEFRKCSSVVAWAEGYYERPFCRAYYNNGSNSAFWMVHEAVHQLNAEASSLRLAKWAEEGVATYFSTSVYAQGAFRLGDLDWNTYPLWWIEGMRLSGDINKDIADTQIIPLRAVVTNRGGPVLDWHFNLYYIHWWSLTHFLFHYENGKYRSNALQVLREGGTLKSFEKHIGPIAKVQTEWYRYLQELQRQLNSPLPRNRETNKTSSSR
ncbi:MAG: hypothetical protein HZA88_10925 [Verrucomicrobia bacterium]|nr:hypothetical protein [Verrucomicrobiota bacterium]